jgi:anthranilate synthase
MCFLNAEPIKEKKFREDSQRDLVLYLPDEILVVDNQRNDAWKLQYDFNVKGKSTKNLSRVSSKSTFNFAAPNIEVQRRDVEKGDYAKSVVSAKEEFRVGNLFEVVLSQAFREKLKVKPSVVFTRLCQRNPAPYGFFMNLGQEEYLVGASPEMFVRVEETSKGMRVETCPISGTIERGDSPLEDALQIKKLLLSGKEESELTMCTDVDRNDKSRICVPGSVKVLGRRQIEMYSRLIHTVDHVEGYLRAGFDALDAFMCHTWAVTVTGAPKTWAIRFLENTESSPRYWYGGAVGIVGFDGTLNTGLTLRTIRVKNGVAEVRAGATLLHDSDPDAEEAETELKASALLDAINRASDSEREVGQAIVAEKHIEIKKNVLLVDHEDSFVHTLANYLRQTGAEVKVVRSGNAFLDFVAKEVDTKKFIPDLTVLSPGPGSPSDFKLSLTIDEMIKRRIPIFGVCLGLQGLVEHFGGNLDVLSYPMHGKPSQINRVLDSIPITEKSSTITDVLNGLPTEFQVARYHSLHARMSTFPKDFAVTAVSKDGIVMAIQHKSMPIAAVQFHPESILTLPRNGMKILTNALEHLTPAGYASQ